MTSTDNVTSIAFARQAALAQNIGSRHIKAMLEAAGIHASRRQLRLLAAEGVLNNEVLATIFDRLEEAA